MSALGFLLAPEPPPKRIGASAALLLVALCTLIVYPLKHVAPVGSLSVIYLPAVLIVTIIWGGGLGMLTALLSAGAFNLFHLPPVGHFTIRGSRDWVALIIFFVVAGIASSLAEVTRARARDAQERRREADLAAEMARLRAASVAARIILPPPEACTVSMLTPRFAASQTAAATVFGMSWYLRSRKTLRPEATRSRTTRGPSAV